MDPELITATTNADDWLLMFIIINDCWHKSTLHYFVLLKSAAQIRRLKWQKQSKYLTKPSKNGLF